MARKEKFSGQNRKKRGRRKRNREKKRPIEVRSDNLLTSVLALGNYKVLAVKTPSFFKYHDLR